MTFSQFSQNSNFLRKKCFFTKILFWSGISNFLGPKRTFSVLGLQKTSQKLVFIKVSEPGSQKTDSGPKNHLWAPEMLKIVKFR